MDAAITQFQQALAVNPNDAMANVNLGTALSQKGQLDEAIVRFQKAAQVQPANYGVHDSLGLLLYQRRRLDEAIAQFRTAFEMQPAQPAARDHLNRIAWMMAVSPVDTVRDGARSMVLAQELVQLSGGNDLVLLTTLAAACAETGHFPDAVTAATRAHEMAVQQQNSEWAAALAAQLDLYRAGKPFRDTHISGGGGLPAQGR